MRILFVLLSAHSALLSASDRVIEALALPEGEQITLDGRLDEPIWQQANVASGFVQEEPYEGEPATESTEVRILFDRTQLYIGVICFDSQPEGILTTSLKRDFTFEDNDTFGVIFDPFDDNRNGFLFVTTPDGARREVQTTNNGANTNANWDAVWYARTQRDSRGWSLELAIPFKSIRFPQGSNRPWGVNFNRRVRRKNEVSVWNPIPRRYSLSRVSLAGTLRGIEEISPGQNLKVTPYGLFEYRRQAGQDDTDVQAGIDAKYSLTTTTTLDLTFNTDFSEVEVDEQQVNLDRFPLLFPEKRPFFLESADLFHFGVRPSEKSGGPSPEEFIGFFSRRIGLSPERRPLPIWGGARLTGQSGPYSAGVLQIFSRAEDPFPAVGYTAIRAKRNILGRSDFGGIFLNRDGASGDYTRMAGGDLNLQFMEKLNLTSFFARSFSPGKDNSTHAGKIFAGWIDTFGEIIGTYVDIGDNFDDSMSFVPRKGVRAFRGSVDLRPRPRVRGIREFNPHISYRYITDQDSELQTRRTHVGLWTYFHDGSRVEFYQNSSFERLKRPFEIDPGTVLPVGGYNFNQWVIQYFHDPSRALTGRVRYEWGEFWSGHRKAFNYGATFRIKPHLEVEAGHQHNRVDLPEGNFTTDLVSLRLHYGVSTRQFFDAFVQYNSQGNLRSAQFRYNLIHRPLSDLFVVFQEERGETSQERIRVFTVKFTRLIDF